MGKVLDHVKIIHSSELKIWTRFPEYHYHHGPTLGEYRARREAAEAILWELRHIVRAQNRPTKPDVNTDLGHEQHEVVKLKEESSQADAEACVRLAEAQSSRYLQPLLFVSHRWAGIDHPDPEGQQLASLQTLKDCFLIYDYASFPQNTTAPEDKQALLDVLAGMNELISSVVVLTSPDFLERGWCIYEYIVASMRASIVCDELNDPNFVMLRNLAATEPPVSLRISGHSIESRIQNAKNQRTLETVNAILPLFNRSKFTVERDREIVQDLLASELVRILPGKMEYMEYVGEWKTIPWTKEELRAAFTSELKWKSLDFASSFRPFEPKVSSTLAEAVTNGYRLDEMPKHNEMTWLTLFKSDSVGDSGKQLTNAITNAVLVIGLIAVGVFVLGLVLLFLLVRWTLFPKH